MKTLALSLMFALASSTSFAAPAPKAPTVEKAKSGTDGMIRVATCNDGKEYWARTNEHRGACSGHGGVAVWADGSEVKSNGRKTAYK